MRRRGKPSSCKRRAKARSAPNVEKTLKPGTAEIPVPGITPEATARIFQWVVLESACVEPEFASHAKQLLAIRRDKMGHALALPHMMVQPQPTIHCVDHTFDAAFELSDFEVLRSVGFWQRAGRAGDGRESGATLLTGELSLSDSRRDGRRAAYEHGARDRKCQRMCDSCGPASAGHGPPRHRRARREIGVEAR